MLPGSHKYSCYLLFNKSKTGQGGERGRPRRLCLELRSEGLSWEVPGGLRGWPWGWARGPVASRVCSTPVASHLEGSPSLPWYYVELWTGWRRSFEPKPLLWGCLSQPLQWHTRFRSEDSGWHCLNTRDFIRGKRLPPSWSKLQIGHPPGSESVRKWDRIPTSWGQPSNQTHCVCVCVHFCLLFIY